MAALSTLLPVFAMLGLGMAARIFGWVTPDQKAGANRIVFGVLFPVMIFNLLASAELSLDVLPVVGYILAMYLVALLVVGPLTARFTGEQTAHFSKYLLVTHEGGNVALPLYLSIVGASSTTVIFDLAGTATAFIVVPVMVAREASTGASPAQIVRNIVTNPFIIAVTAGLVLNLTGLYGAIVASPFGDAWTSTFSMITSPIIGTILFVLGYDLKVDKDAVAPLLKLGLVRLAWSLIIIAGFFVLFGPLVADRLYLMAVLIYFSCPTGFGLTPLLQPLYRSERDGAFTSAFMSLYIVITLVVYTGVVLFLA